MDNGLFYPDSEVTLNQLWAIILSAKYGKQQIEGGDWRIAYQKLALKTGIGEDVQIQNADEPMERVSAARVCHLFLQNVIGEADETVTYGAEDLKDFYTCASCMPHLDQVYSKGIVSGRPDGNFDGFATLTRAEACVLVMKTIDSTLRNPKKQSAPKTAEPELSITNDEISPSEAVKLLDASDIAVILLDVRTLEEYKEKHIPGSVLIPLNTLSESAPTLLPDKNARIIVYCQAGTRARQACDLLKKAGYKNVYNLGGINSWPYETESE
jgi:rhodanese-related sulfurtransferase